MNREQEKGRANALPSVRVGEVKLLRAELLRVKRLTLGAGHRKYNIKRIRP